MTGEPRCHMRTHPWTMYTRIPRHWIGSSIQSCSIKIGIRRESKNKWECRTPIVPTHVKQLLQEAPTAQIIVQPCSRRVFPNGVFEAAGATIQEDLSECDLILGVKEIPTTDLLPNKAYLFFSHTHKGQRHNMPMLQHVLKKNITLLDYELLTDDKGKRTVRFGYFAGIVGVINGIHGLGEHLLSYGYRTPFLTLGQAHHYINIAHIKEALGRVSDQLSIYGLPQALGPMVFCVTGTGNVSSGVMDMLTLLPHEIIRPEHLPSLCPQSSSQTARKYDPKKIYILHVPASDYLCDEHGKYDRDDYHANPAKYQSKFHKIIAPYISALFNGIYWDNACPRLLTASQLSQLATANRLRLLSIADISMDLNGSIEMVRQTTNIDEPFFLYDPITEQISHDNATDGLDPIKRNLVQIMAIDNLPSELPQDASEYFSDHLFPYMAEYVRTNGQALALPHFRKAMIVEQGKILPHFSELLTKRLAEFGNEPEKTLKKVSKPPKKVLLLGSGYVTKPFLWYFSSGIRSPYDLATLGEINVTVASQHEQELEALKKYSMSMSPRTPIQCEKIDLSATDANTLTALVSNYDVVVSLLPAPMHPVVAKACIAAKKHMVTASYVSPEMQALNDAAKEANVAILNEIGLDPGIDHMSAMRIIDSAKQSGNRVKAFVSWCGGLPAPEHSGNPFGYKFSWNPKGAISAILKAAKYRKNGKIISIDATQVLKAAIPVQMFPGFAFEGYPNRDSVHYETIYGLSTENQAPMSSIETTFRGTLRYRGYSAIMDGLITLGLLDDNPKQTAGLSGCSSWADAMKVLLQSDPYSFEQAIKDRVPNDGGRVYRALQWLGAFSLYEPFDKKAPTLLDAICGLLQKKLLYAPSERDLAFLTNTFVLENAQGNRETMSSTLLCYGGSGVGDGPDMEGCSAMAKTVGLPVAIATELLLTVDAVPERGVLVPLKANIYGPILERLRKCGIQIIEQKSPVVSELYVP